VKIRHARPDIVLGYALATLVSFAKQELGKGTPLFSGLAVPLRGRGQILRHARRHPPAYSAHQHFLARYFCRPNLKPWSHLFARQDPRHKGCRWGSGPGRCPHPQMAAAAASPWHNLGDHRRTLHPAAAPPGPADPKVKAIAKMQHRQRGSTRRLHHL
jgi:hypothetical protein